MEVHLNRIDGIDDAIISMHMSKRTITRDLEMEIRNETLAHSAMTYDGARPLGALVNPSEKLIDWLTKLFKWGVAHYTMLRFIDLSFMVYGMHRAGQDDLDAHAARMNNRIIRSSTRLADFKQGEVSSFYEDKIVPTDVALAYLGIVTPDEIEYNGKTYVRAVNGYIVKGMENNKDAKRGLYMLSIPSNFIFRIQLTEFAHVYRMRNINGTANPEVKEAVEKMADQLDAATLGLIDRKLLDSIRDPMKKYLVICTDESQDVRSVDAYGTEEEANLAINKDAQNAYEEIRESSESHIEVRPGYAKITDGEAMWTWTVFPMKF